MTKKEKIILFLLAGLNFTHLLDFMIMMPLGNYLMPYFRINARQFSLLVSAYSYAAFLSGVIMAFIINNFDRKKVLLVSYGGFILATLGCGLAPTYGFLLISRTVTGIFGGIIGAQVLAIVADIFTYERRGTAMGAVMSAFAVASIIGVPFSLYLTNLFGFNWHVPFLLVGSIGSVLIFCIYRFIPSLSEHIAANGNGGSWLAKLGNALPRQRQITVLFFSGLLMIGHFLIIPFINPYMEFNKGFSKDITPLIFLFGGAASLAGAFLIGRYADKTGKLPVFSLSLLLSLLMTVLVTRMPAVHFSIVLVFFSVWFILITGRTLTAQAMISESVNSGQRGSFMSFNGSIQQLGTGLASTIAGYVVLKDKTGRIQYFDRLGYLSVGVLILTLVLARYLFRHLDKPSGNTELEKELLRERTAPIAE